MFVISTTAFVSVLSLASSVSSLAVVGQVAGQSTGLQSQCTETYTVPQSETCDALLSKLGLSQTSIQSLNPGMTCDGTLPANQVLCIKVKTPTCTRQATATATNCDGLASQYNITPAEFVEYNDNVNSDCTNLVVGQSYCVAIDAISPENTVSVKSDSDKQAVKSDSDSDEIFGHH